MDTNQQFDGWFEVKKEIHESHRTQAIKEGEIWWCAMGKNVGIEIDGKSKTFARPVLIFKKLSRFGFLGIPLTSKPHVGSWYVSFRFQGRNEVAVLSQIRVISVSRLYSKMGDIDDTDKVTIRKAFQVLYLPEDR